MVNVLEMFSIYYSLLYQSISNINHFFYIYGAVDNFSWDISDARYYFEITPTDSRKSSYPL